MKLEKKHIIIFVIVLAIAISIGYMYSNRKSRPYAGPKVKDPADSDYSGGLPFPGESSFDDTKDQNPVLDPAGTKYVAVVSGLGLNKQGSLRIIKGTQLIKHGKDCTGRKINGKWYVPVFVNDADPAWAPINIIKRA